MNLYTDMRMSCNVCMDFLMAAYATGSLLQGCFCYRRTFFLMHKQIYMYTHTCTVMEMSMYAYIYMYTTHTCAYTHRKLFTWGNGGSGRLGHGSLEHKLIPTVVALHSVKLVACGTSHTLVLALSETRGTAVFAFGAGGEGQLGYGGMCSKMVPTQVRGLIEARVVQKLAAGSFHSAAVTDLGSRLFVWGRGEDGQLGTGNSVYQLEPAEVHLNLNPLGLNTINGLACGPYQTAIVLADGVTMMCGKGTSGQLGNDDKQSRFYFSRVAEPGNHRIMEKHVATRREVEAKQDRKWIDGSLWMWNAKEGRWVQCLACALFKDHSCFCKTCPA